MNSDIWVFLKQCDADACVEKIDVVCTHNYQVSTSLTISALCRSSFATVIASAEPPKSPLNFFNASSRRALLSCFNSPLTIFLRERKPLQICPQVV